MLDKETDIATMMLRNSITVCLQLYQALNRVNHNYMTCKVYRKLFKVCQLGRVVVQINIITIINMNYNVSKSH